MPLFNSLCEYASPCVRKERLLNAQCEYTLTTASGDYVRMLSAVGFGQDKRILACATMRGKRCPKHAALRFALVSKIRVLKGRFSPENGDCSLIEHFRERTNTLYDVTLPPISTTNGLNGDGGSHYLSLRVFQGNLSTPVFWVSTPLFKGINPTF